MKTEWMFANGVWISPGAEAELDEDTLETLPPMVEVRSEVERLRKKVDDLQMELAYGKAFNPEVVAEIAVHLSDDADWEEIAKWCGGTIRSAQLPSGDYHSWIYIPGVEHQAAEGSWITLDHHGTFRVRHTVEQPETNQKPVAQGAGGIDAHADRSGPSLATRLLMFAEELENCGEVTDPAVLAAELKEAASRLVH